jgi:hypothetical protein
VTSARKACPSNWGFVRDSRAIEVIEDLLSLRGAEMAVRPSKPVRAVILEPHGRQLHSRRDHGRVTLRVAEFACRQTVLLHR